MSALSNLHPLLLKRRSPRTFSSQSIEHEKIRQLFEAARWSPSCFNEQPWRFLYSQSKEMPQHQRFLDCLTDGNRKWVQDAPVLILALAKKTFSHDGKPNRWAWHDVGLAVANLTFQATALDIYVHQMAGFQYDKAIETFKLAADYEPVSIIALGYLGSRDAEVDISERERRPLAEIVFEGQWK